MKKLILLSIIAAFSISALFAQSKAGRTYSLPHYKYVVSNQSATVNHSPKEELKWSVAKVYPGPRQQIVINRPDIKCIACFKSQNLSQKEIMKSEVMGENKCKMNPGAGNKPGYCPVCGMALARK